MFKEYLFGKNSYTQKIEKKIVERNDFKDCKKIIEEKLKARTGFARNLSVRELRNIAMSRSPESDQKIYTFTFRSELSSHIANISVIIGILGLLTKFIPFLHLTLFKTTTPITILYILLSLSYFFLRYTRDRFYDISVRLPFSIYLEKEIATQKKPKKYKKNQNESNKTEVS